MRQLTSFAPLSQQLGNGRSTRAACCVRKCRSETSGRRAVAKSGTPIGVMCAWVHLPGTAAHWSTSLTTVIVRAPAFPCRVGVKDTGDELPSRPRAVRWAHQPNKQGLRLNYLLRVAAPLLFFSTFTEYIIPYCPSFDNSQFRAFTPSRRYCCSLPVTHSLTRHTHNRR